MTAQLTTFPAGSRERAFVSPDGATTFRLLLDGCGNYRAAFEDAAGTFGDTFVTEREAVRLAQLRLADGWKQTR